jgi:hypothetical protein
VTTVVATVAAVLATRPPSQKERLPDAYSP